MTHPRIRTTAIVTAAALAAAGTLGCGFISSAKNVVGNISTIGDLSDKISKSEQATYQAQYRLQDGSVVTVAQQPPNSAYVSDQGRFVATRDALYLCDRQQGSWTCEKTPNNGTATDDPADASLAAGVTGQGFVSAPLAVAVLTAALVVPSAHVDKSSQQIGGQKSTCAKVSGLEKAQQDGEENQKLSDFTVCVTDAGVLSRFSGTLTDGTKAGIELTGYTTKVDPSLLAPPPGAQITDVEALTATPTPTG